VQSFSSAVLSLTYTQSEIAFQKRMQQQRHSRKQDLQRERKSKTHRDCVQLPAKRGSNLTCHQQRQGCVHTSGDLPLIREVVRQGGEGGAVSGRGRGSREAEDPIPGKGPPLQPGRVRGRI